MGKGRFWGGWVGQGGGVGHLRIHLLLDNSQEDLSPALLLLKAVKCAVLLILLLVIGRGEGGGGGGGVGGVGRKERRRKRQREREGEMEFKKKNLDDGGRSICDGGEEEE